MTVSAPGARRLLALAVLGPVGTLATACSPASGSGSPAATVTTTITPAECATAGLHVKVGSGSAAAGTVFYPIEFTNVSGAACLLQGYPAVSLVSAGSDAGSQIGAGAKRDPANPKAPIVLAPGQTAHAALGVEDALDLPKSPCDPVNAHWLKVLLPDQTVAAYARLGTQTCASVAVPTMRITAISAGG
jgi:hypothetical protein